MMNAIKITRRKLAALLVSFHALRPDARAQTPAGDALQAARERVKAASDALAKEQIPMATEPAFRFKA
jgi:hypothetical protein